MNKEITIKDVIEFMRCDKIKGGNGYTFTEICNSDLVHSDNNVSPSTVVGFFIPGEYWYECEDDE